MSTRTRWAPSLVADIIPTTLALALLIAVVAIAWWLLNQQRVRMKQA